VRQRFPFIVKDEDVTTSASPDVRRRQDDQWRSTTNLMNKGRQLSSAQQEQHLRLRVSIDKPGTPHDK
jgi:hypothetical protein